MSIATQLGLEGPDADLLRRATRRWPQWAGEHPPLVEAPALPGLRTWMRSLDLEPRNDVVCALARLGSQAGSDDVPAAAVLAWALIPGATKVARSLRTASPVIDELVAAQLWIEVRTLPVTATHRVAANVLANMAKAVRRDLGLSAPRERSWARCIVLDPLEAGWQNRPAPHEVLPPQVELRDLLERARREQVVTPEDCDLLLHLADAADAAPSVRCSRRSGLTMHEATGLVAQRYRISDRQVRRRAARSLDALSDAYASGVPA